MYEIKTLHTGYKDLRQKHRKTNERKSFDRTVWRFVVLTPPHRGVERCILGCQWDSRSVLGSFTNAVPHLRRQKSSWFDWVAILCHMSLILLLWEMWRLFRSAALIGRCVRSQYEVQKIRPFTLREPLSFFFNCVFIAHQVELHHQFHCLLCYNDNKYFLEHTCVLESIYDTSQANYLHKKGHIHCVKALSKPLPVLLYLS